jgi:DNA-binding transcriptional MocR family regulator
VNDLEIAEAARAGGIGISALSPLHLTPRLERGLLVGYGRLPEPSIRAAVAALGDVIEAIAGP